MNAKARRDDLLFTDVEDQLVVYDDRAHVTHCLNAVAAQVWRLADGSRSDADLAAAVADRHAGDGTPALVELALHRLREARLLEPDADGPLPSRRQVMRAAGLGAAAAAAALVTTVVVPRAAAALSCLPNGSPCGVSPCCAGCQCFSGTCHGACA